MKVALYARVSTDGQTPENQVRELVGVGQRLGWEVVGTYIDHGISGAKGRHQRPAFDQLLKGVTRREFDLVAAWSVDRLSRSLPDLIQFLQEIRGRSVGLYLHQQGLDTTTPAGRAMLQMLGVFAEFERALIQERVRAGLARARSQGKRLGRPPAPDELMRRIRRTLAEGNGIHKTARLVGCGVGTVQKVKAALTSAVAVNE